MIQNKLASINFTLLIFKQDLIAIQAGKALVQLPSSDDGIGDSEPALSAET